MPPEAVYPSRAAGSPGPSDRGRVLHLAGTCHIAVSEDRSFTLRIFSLVEGHHYRCVTQVDLRKKRVSAPGGPSPSHAAGQAPDTGEEIEVTLPVLSLAPCDCGFLSSENASCLLTGISAGLFISNLAHSELEAILRGKDFRSLSIQVAGSCAVMSKTSGREIALVEVDPAAPVRSQRCPGLGRDPSVLPRIEAPVSYRLLRLTKPKSPSVISLVKSHIDLVKDE
eukprot:bmy_22456T0